MIFSSVSFHFYCNFTSIIITSYPSSLFYSHFIISISLTSSISHINFSYQLLSFYHHQAIPLHHHQILLLCHHQVLLFHHQIHQILLLHHYITLLSSISITSPLSFCYHLFHYFIISYLAFIITLPS